MKSRLTNGFPYSLALGRCRLTLLVDSKKGSRSKGLGVFGQPVAPPSSLPDLDPHPRGVLLCRLSFISLITNLGQTNMFVAQLNLKLITRIEAH